MHHYYAVARIAQDRIDDMTRAAARRNEYERWENREPARRRRRRWPR